MFSWHSTSSNETYVMLGGDVYIGPFRDLRTAKACIRDRDNDFPSQMFHDLGMVPRPVLREIDALRAELAAAREEIATIKDMTKVFANAMMAIEHALTDVGMPDSDTETTPEVIRRHFGATQPGTTPQGAHVQRAHGKAADVRRDLELEDAWSL